MESGKILHQRYELKQQLGYNNSCQTWLALDQETNQKVVIKLLCVHPQMEWTDLKLFEREAQVLKNIAHPRIPQYLDYFTIEKKEEFDFPWFALVQDYIPGINLKNLLEKERKLTQRQIYYIAEDLLEILIYLHELIPPIFHRDLKPSNIILGENKRFYLVDFGGVQDKARAEGVTFTVVGTSGYTPPEQLWGKTVPASDLYALGVTLIHLLTGINPNNLPQSQMQIQFKDYVNVTPQFSYWLERLIQPAPEKRFKTARLALDNLPQYEEEIINQKPPNYGCGCLLSGVSLLIIGGIISAVLLAFNEAKKQEQNYASLNYMMSLNRAQQAFYVEKQQFTYSLSALGLPTDNTTAQYYYQIEVTKDAVFHRGIATKSGLKNYIGAVFVVPSDRRDHAFSKMETVSIICESMTDDQVKLTHPKLENNQPICTEGIKSP